MPPGHLQNTQTCPRCAGPPSACHCPQLRTPQPPPLATHTPARSMLPPQPTLVSPASPSKRQRTRAWGHDCVPCLKTATACSRDRPACRQCSAASVRCKYEFGLPGEQPAAPTRRAPPSPPTVPKRGAAIVEDFSWPSGGSAAAMDARSTSARPRTPPLQKATHPLEVFKCPPTASPVTPPPKTVHKKCTKPTPLWQPSLPASNEGDYAAVVQQYPNLSPRALQGAWRLAHLRFAPARAPPLPPEVAGRPRPDERGRGSGRPSKRPFSQVSPDDPRPARPLRSNRLSTARSSTPPAPAYSPPPPLAVMHVLTDLPHLPEKPPLSRHSSDTRQRALLPTPSPTETATSAFRPSTSESVTPTNGTLMLQAHTPTSDLSPVLEHPPSPPRDPAELDYSILSRGPEGTCYVCAKETQKLPPKSKISGKKSKIRLYFIVLEGERREACCACQSYWRYNGVIRPKKLWTHLPEEEREPPPEVDTPVASPAVPTLADSSVPTADQDPTLKKMDVEELHEE